jgi:hypothetical protein
LLEIISKKLPWVDVYENNRVLLNALAKPDNAIIFENICLTQRAPEKLRTILCHCCSWQKNDRPKFPTIVRDLSAISDVDLQNINQGKEKSIVPKTPKARPLTGKTRPSTKASSSSSSAFDFDDFNSAVDWMAEIKCENPNPKPKPLARRQTDDSANQSNNAESVRYDAVHNRQLYKGPRGGWFYIGPTGKKIYEKTDSV